METIQERADEVREIQWAGCTIRIKIEKVELMDGFDISVLTKKNLRIFSSQVKWRCPEEGVEQAVEHMIFMAKRNCEAVERIIADTLKEVA